MGGRPCQGTDNQARASGAGANLGLHLKKQMPMFRMLKKEIFGDADLAGVPDSVHFAACKGSGKGGRASYLAISIRPVFPSASPYGWDAAPDSGPSWGASP